MSRKFEKLRLFLSVLILFAACKKDDSKPGAQTKDPNTAEMASVDRFSSTAGHLQVRTSANGLPAADMPVDFDKAPFITKGLTPDGKSVDYYNFDMQSTKPAPIWVLFREGQSTSVEGNNIIDVIPGDTGYNDFWQVYKVTVPADYVANTITSYQEILSGHYTITKTNDLVNCPVVPKGSTASKRFTTESTGLTQGWYKSKVVYYFNFSERPLSVSSTGSVPLSLIYVSFNINPNLPNGGPASGFKTETGASQTHNVVATIPADAGYSPLWVVRVYDNSAFNNIMDLESAASAPVLVPDAGAVNCPVVNIQ